MVLPCDNQQLKKLSCALSLDSTKGIFFYQKKIQSKMSHLVLLSFSQVAGIHLTFNMDTCFGEYDKQKNVALSTVVIMMAIFKRRA
ncbi:hypothetical protein AGMMS49592_2780 [Endomicrobiia bacterium]|nr:hypothetical protein AGMMS49592_2780 [Endomicrobiia bacterium]